ncbi:MAG: hypothetical protein ACKVY0_05575 [Prosthecobacter sp.]|uniref:hypothetical protein n=1 Tax=Prosthecobacter sp. TaxID=1965333 RepID=UPI0038FEC2AE
MNPALLQEAIDSILTHAPLSNQSQETARGAIEVAQAVLAGRAKAGAGWHHRTNRAFALPAQTACLAQAVVPFEIPGSAIGQGGEHVAKYDPAAGIVYKTNLPEARKYGYVVDQAGEADDLRLCLREALPSEYLLRLGLQNVVFGDAISLQAIASNPCIEDYPLIVTAQPYAGGEMPTLEEIAMLMMDAGFKELPMAMLRPAAFRSPVWYHAENEIAATDATPGNFTKLSNDVIVPIDLIIHPLPLAILQETARRTKIDLAV